VVVVGAMAGAQAQDRGPLGVVFDGMARTGSDTRPVRFRFFCSPNSGPNVTGVLAVELEIPHYEQLRRVFDFEPFEGPDAHAGPLTTLLADGARRAGDHFTAAGSVVASGGSEAFMLGIDASRRDPGPLHKLSFVLHPLTEGRAQLTWLQGNPKPGGVTMTATLDLGQARSEQLKSGLGPCLGAR